MASISSGPGNTTSEASSAMRPSLGLTAGVATIGAILLGSLSGCYSPNFRDEYISGHSSGVAPTPLPEAGADAKNTSKNKIDENTLTGARGVAPHGRS